MQSSELSKSSNQRQTLLEQQLRDLRLTSEKYQISMQAQLDAYAKQASLQENQIHALESANSLLKDELSSTKTDNEFLLAMVKEDKQIIKEFQQQIEDLNEEHRLENEELQNALKRFRQESENNENAYLTLKNSFNEIEKRCVKHQKSEIEVKKQLTVYKEFVNDLQRKVQELTDRLSIGADEYKSLYRKYAALERMIVKANQQTKSNPTTLSNETGLNEEALVTLLRNSYELQQQETQEEEEEEEEEDNEEKKIITTTTTSSQNSVDNQEIRECPMCYWEFPKHLTLENKKEHIENHFA
jgi:chromosome segregation ATPase